MQPPITKRLDSLATRLAAIFEAGLATQQSVSQRTGVPQSTISKALNRKLKRVTSDICALENHSDILLEPRELSAAVRLAAEGFLAVGGREADLVDVIRLSTRLVRRWGSH